jgi:hypothetical protein
MQRSVGNSATGRYLQSHEDARSKTVQRDAEIVSFPPELVLSLPPGIGPASFIQDQANLMKEAVGLFWDNYSNGLMNFQTSMEFSSDQEAESHYLNTALKAVAKVDLEVFLDEVGEKCPVLGIYLKQAKEAITAELEEKERVEKAEGEVKIVEFIDEIRNSIGETKAKDLDAFNAQVRPMQDAYARENADSGTGDKLLSDLEAGQKMLRSFARARSAAVFQQRFTEAFAREGSPQVGPLTAGDYKNATMYLSCVMYRDEKDAFSIRSISDSWELKTNAPKADRVASSLNRALKEQHKKPFEAELPKVVRATVDVESGHWYAFNSYDDTSYEFTDIEDMHFNGGDAILHGNSPDEFRDAWDAVLKERVKGIKGLDGSGA